MKQDHYMTPGVLVSDGQAVPSGYVMVPVECTAAMENAYDDKCVEDGEHEECGLYRPAYNAMLAAAPAPAEHPDDLAVDRFAIAMKAKLAVSREKGRYGWESCTAPHLSSLLWNHVYKADPLDVGNLAMMLHQNGQCIELPWEARRASAAPAPAERVQGLSDDRITSIIESVAEAIGSHKNGWDMADDRELVEAFAITLRQSPQPSPDVAGLVEALADLIAAGNKLDAQGEECMHDDFSAEVAASGYWCEFREGLEAAIAALSAHRQQEVQ